LPAAARPCLVRSDAHRQRPLHDARRWQRPTARDYVSGDLQPAEVMRERTPRARKSWQTSSVKMLPERAERLRLLP
jgi:hypothetical protein